jgi:hypothetical protein
MNTGELHERIYAPYARLGDRTPDQLQRPAGNRSRPVDDPGAHLPSAAHGPNLPLAHEGLELLRQLGVRGRLSAGEQGQPAMS